MVDQHPDRRSVLAALGVLAAAGLLGGCASRDSDPVALPAEVIAPVDPQQIVEQDLIARYIGVITAFPETAATLGVIVDQHREHLRALGGQPGDEGQPTQAATTAEAVRALIAAEQRATEEHRDAAAQATDPIRARLLTLIAASEASHAIALGMAP